MCDLKATFLQYLVAIEIKAIAATKRNPGAQYTRRVGVGEFVASGLLNWAANRDDVPPSRAQCKLITNRVGANSMRLGTVKTTSIAASLPIIALTAACWASVLATVVWLAYHL